MADYQFDPLDPELQKLIDAKMAQDVPQLSSPDLNAPKPSIEPNFGLGAMSAPEIPPTPEPNQPSRQEMLDKMREDLFNKMQNSESDRSAYQASVNKAREDAGPSSLQKGAGYIAAALQGMATKGQDLSMAGNLKKGWQSDADKAASLVKNPSLDSQEKLNQYIKMNAIERSNLAPGEKMALKEKELEAAKAKEAEAEKWRQMNYSQRERAINAAEREKNLTREEKAAKGTVGEQEIDKKFAKDLNDWQVSGQGTYQKNIDRLKEARDLLEKNKDANIGTSGRFEGRLPDWMRSEQSVAIREKAHAAAQGALKATLGAQFTEKEGERIMAQSYNEKLSPEENIHRLNGAIAELESNANTMNQRASQFTEKGTLQKFAPSAMKSAAPTKVNAGKIINSGGKRYKVADDGDTLIPLE